MKSRTQSQKESEALRALTLHNQGATQRDIARIMTDEGMPISQPTVNRRIELARTLYVVPALKEARAEELSRLDSLLEVLSTKIQAGDVNAVKAAIAISGLRSKMLGLDKVNADHVEDEVPMPSMLGMLRSV